MQLFSYNIYIYKWFFVIPDKVSSYNDVIIPVNEVKFLRYGAELPSFSMEVVLPLAERIVTALNWQRNRGPRGLSQYNDAILPV